MQSNRHALHFIFLLVTICWWPFSAHASQPEPDNKKVNLAIRRTADKLLRISGDSTSRINAVERISPLVWRLHLDQTFLYDSLPALLQSSLDFYGITNTYDVTVRRCENDAIDLGYQQLDFVRDSLAPCGGRNPPEGCHYIEVAFAVDIVEPQRGIVKNLLLILGLTGGAGLLIWFRRKSNPDRSV